MKQSDNDYDGKMEREGTVATVRTTASLHEPKIPIYTQGTEKLRTETDSVHIPKNNIPICVATYIGQTAVKSPKEHRDNTGHNENHDKD